MLFLTYEPYIEKNEIIHYNAPTKDAVEINTCLICFQSQDECVTPIRDMNKIFKYYKICKCIGFIHENCIDKWFQTSKTCPICRTTILMKENFFYIVIENILHANIYDIYFFIFIKYLVYAIAYMFFCIYFTYIFYSVYLTPIYFQYVNL